MMEMRSAIAASLIRWIYDFIKVLPTCLPWCSGSTAREWMAIVLPYSSCPIISPFSVTTRALLQLDGNFMELSVTSCVEVRVAMI
jgi:hypothetical protein